MAHVFIKLNDEIRDSLLKIISLYVDNSLIVEKIPVENPHITLFHSYKFERSVSILQRFNKLAKLDKIFSFEITDIVVTEDVIYALVKPLTNELDSLLDPRQILHITLALMPKIKPVFALCSARNLESVGTLKLSYTGACEGSLKINIF